MVLTLLTELPHVSCYIDAYEVRVESGGTYATHRTNLYDLSYRRRGGNGSTYAAHRTALCIPWHKRRPGRGMVSLGFLTSPRRIPHVGRGCERCKCTGLERGEGAYNTIILVSYLQVKSLKSFEDRPPTDRIYGRLISKWIADPVPLSSPFFLDWKYECVLLEM